MTTSIDEWIAGTKADGTALPRHKVNRYRKRRGLPPLSYNVNTTVQRQKPEPGSPEPWNPSMPSRGLGDTVAKVTNAVGIKSCGGCKKRQEKLNSLVPFGAGDKTDPPKSSESDV
jgi:hypothetical protein